jgi:hypothetical protein
MKSGVVPYAIAARLGHPDYRVERIRWDVSGSVFNTASAYWTFRFSRGVWTCVA